MTGTLGDTVTMATVGRKMKRFGGQLHQDRMGFRAPIPGPQRDKLEQLRLTLERLERTGDLTSPSVAGLRRIILDRHRGNRRDCGDCAAHRRGVKARFLWLANIKLEVMQICHKTV